MGRRAKSTTVATPIEIPPQVGARLCGNSSFGRVLVVLRTPPRPAAQVTPHVFRRMWCLSTRVKSSRVVAMCPPAAVSAAPTVTAAAAELAHVVTERAPAGAEAPAARGTPYVPARRAAAAVVARRAEVQDAVAPAPDLTKLAVRRVDAAAGLRSDAAGRTPSAADAPATGGIADLAARRASFAGEVATAPIPVNPVVRLANVAAVLAPAVDPVFSEGGGGGIPPPTPPPL